MKKMNKNENQLCHCEKEHQQLAAEFSKTGLLLDGTITKRRSKCGKPSCACHRDPDALHGPYYHWTAKQRGKTVTVSLDAEQAELCQQWIQNNKEARARVSQMRALTRRVARLRGIPLK